MRIGAKVGLAFVGVLSLAGMLLPCSGLAEEQPQPRIYGIANVELRSTNLEKAHDFYVEVLYAVQNAHAPAGMMCESRPSILPVLLQSVKGTLPSNLLQSVSFEIDDARAMARLLEAKKIRFTVDAPVDGEMSVAVTDPEGHRVNFIERARRYELARECKKEVTVRIIHAGFVVKDRAEMDKFYKDVLAFRLYWSGGMKEGETNWVAMQVPDGTDWIEYMLNVPENVDHHTLGVMNHISLGVPSVADAAQQLEKRGMKLPEQPKIGRDGKWQLNLYDPDGTRVELMEFTPVEKPCCSEFTGPHPKP